ncbi:MAG: hypothetical protein ACRCZ9_03420 [Fusobacteriaceae bacterium]
MLENETKKNMLDSIRGELKKEPIVSNKTEEIVNKKTLKNRERRQKKKQINKSIPKIIIKQELGEEEKKTRLTAFKLKYIEKEVNKDFLDLLNVANSSNDEAFSEEDFLEAKMENSSARVIVLDPSTDDIALGKGYKWYLVKPLYVTEYMDFVKKFGPRESFPQEFLEYCFKKCLILPKLTEEKKEEIPSGTILTLYRTMLDISDFNKKYRIIEV